MPQIVICYTKSVRVHLFVKFLLRGFCIFLKELLCSLECQVYGTVGSQSGFYECINGNICLGQRMKTLPVVPVRLRQKPELLTPRCHGDTLKEF